MQIEQRHFDVRVLDVSFRQMHGFSQFSSEPRVCQTTVSEKGDDDSQLGFDEEVGTWNKGIKQRSKVALGPSSPNNLTCLLVWVPNSQCVGSPLAHRDTDPGAIVHELDKWTESKCDKQQPQSRMLCCCLFMWESIYMIIYVLRCTYVTNPLILTFYFRMT